jgi:hypothetical protein
VSIFGISGNGIYSGSRTGVPLILGDLTMNESLYDGGLFGERIIV